MTDKLFTPLRPACQTEKLMQCMHTAQQLLSLMPYYVGRVQQQYSEAPNTPFFIRFTTDGRNLIPPTRIRWQRLTRRIPQMEIDDSNVNINNEQEVRFADGTTGTVHIVFNKRVDSVRILIRQPDMQYTFSTKNCLYLLNDLIEAFPQIAKKLQLRKTQTQ